MSNPAKGGGNPAPSQPKAELRVGMAIYDKVYPETLGSVYQLGQYAILDFVSGVYVDQARNSIAERTTEPYLLFVDADMIFTLAQLDELRKALDEDPTIGAIGGLYTYRNRTIKPIVGWIEDDHWMGGRYLYDRTLKNMESGAIDDVDSFGTGFLLIRTEAMKSIGDPYFKVHWDEETNSFWGEDVLFCKRLKEAGWRSCIHFGVQCGHIGKAVYTPSMLLDIDPEELTDAVQ